MIESKFETRLKATSPMLAIFPILNLKFSKFLEFIIYALLVGRALFELRLRFGSGMMLHV